MIARFGPGPGCIVQLILGFGVGLPIGGVAIGSMGKLDFSKPGNSELIAVLRRF